MFVKITNLIKNKSSKICKKLKNIITFALYKARIDKII
jgi:hypothetical protein